jgi:hypothetical protein
MSDDPADLDLYKSEYDSPQDVAVERGRSPLLLGVAVILGLALGGAYWYLRAPSRQPAPAAARPVEPSQNARPAERAEEIPLPPLDETDPLVRELVGQLSSHPAVAAWMATDGLILNFTAVTLMISNGESPAQELRTVVRVPAFQPRTSREDLFVAPSSYQRYDRYADAVAALDARGAARLYTTLKPRILDAYRRMNQPTGGFDPVLERAIVELLRVPAVKGDIELAPHGIGYAYVDPRLESLSPAQKHLLRMGPKNVQAIQSKLREIADYLAIPAARLR